MLLSYGMNHRYRYGVPKSKTIQTNTQNLCLSPLMLENSLPLLGNTSACANVLFQGVNTGFHSVPPHHINSKLDYVSGQVVVGGTTYTSC